MDEQPHAEPQTKSSQHHNAKKLQAQTPWTKQKGAGLTEKCLAVALQPDSGHETEWRVVGLEVLAEPSSNVRGQSCGRHVQGDGGGDVIVSRNVGSSEAHVEVRNDIVRGTRAHPSALPLTLGPPSRRCGRW